MFLFMNPQHTAHQRFCKLLLVLLMLLIALTSLVFSAPEPVRYSRAVLPILATNCFSCHGPDEKNRQAGLRLDLEADAKANRRSGFPIAPGQPEKSVNSPA